MNWGTLHPDYIQLIIGKCSRGYLCRYDNDNGSNLPNKFMTKLASINRHWRKHMERYRLSPEQLEEDELWNWGYYDNGKYWKDTEQYRETILTSCNLRKTL